MLKAFERCSSCYFVGSEQCVLNLGHDGEHRAPTKATESGLRRWTTCGNRHPLYADIHCDRPEGHAKNGELNCSGRRTQDQFRYVWTPGRVLMKVCGAINPSAPDVACDKDAGHAGKHRAFIAGGGSIAVWESTTDTTPPAAPASKPMCCEQPKNGVEASCYLTKGHTQPHKATCMSTGDVVIWSDEVSPKQQMIEYSKVNGVWHRAAKQIKCGKHISGTMYCMAATNHAVPVCFAYAKYNDEEYVHWYKHESRQSGTTKLESISASNLAALKNNLPKDVMIPVTDDIKVARLEAGILDSGEMISLPPAAAAAMAPVDLIDDTEDKDILNLVNKVKALKKSDKLVAVT